LEPKLIITIMHGQQHIKTVVFFPFKSGGILEYHCTLKG